MTINKAQGQTLARVGVYLPKPVFTHGQLYVALSRVGGPELIRVLIEAGELQFQITEDDDATAQPGTYTLNVVWKEALLTAAPPETAPPPALPKRQLNLRAAFQRGRSSRDFSSGASPPGTPAEEDEPLDAASGPAV